MEVYLMRHGLTVSNERKITQGLTKGRLSKTGKIQTLEQAEKCKYINFDVIFSSPLARAIQTSNIMNRFHNVKIIKQELLTGIDQGIFTNRYYFSLTDEEKQLKLLRTKETKMESYKNVFNRVKCFYDKILKKSKYEKVLIVSHGVVVSFLEYIINGATEYIKEFKSNLYCQAEIKKFEI